jgi:tetratricopeptide (TPR) repeat protein
MRARRLLFYLLLAGLLARVIYLNQAAALPFFHDPVGDSARYLERAREILQGRLIADRPFFYGGILYPWLLALDLLLFGSNLYPVCLLQAGVGCALAWVLYRFTIASASGHEAPAAPWMGLVAATMALFYGPFAFFEADILMISWTLLLMMSGGLLALEAIRQQRPGPCAARLAGAGVCFALAATERPNLLLLIPALALWCLCFAPPRWRVAAGAALWSGAALVLIAVAGLNHAASGRWVLLTTSSGINFYIGNHEGATGTFDEPWSAGDREFALSHYDLEESSLAMARRMSGRPLDPVDASAFWFHKGLEFAREHPGRTARLAARKLALFWGAEEVPNHLDFTFMRSMAPALWLMPLGFGLVAPLGLYGFAAGTARRMLSHAGIVLLALLVLVPMVTMLPFFVADRYRAPVVAPLMVMGAGGLITLGRLLRFRLTRNRALLHIVCVVLAGLAMTRASAGLRQTDTSRDDWMMAQAFRKQGDLASAVTWYERAVQASPDDAALRNGLGVALAQSGQLDRAESQYRKAVELAPDLVLPRRNLGLILMRHGPAAAAEALANLSVAEKADPGSLDVARAMAALLLSEGDPAGARERALRILKSAPDDPAAREILSRTGGLK